MAENKKKINILKILGIALGILYFVLLLVHDAYESRDFEVMEAILPNASIRIIMTILRAFTSGSVMIAIFSCFYSFKYLSRGVRYFSPIVVLLNIIFIKYNFDCFLGNNYSTLLFIIRLIGFILENALIMIISFLNWKEFIKKEKHDKCSIKEIFISVLVILGIIIFSLPATTFMSFKGGLIGFTPKNFNIQHIIVLLFTISLPIVITLIFKDKSLETRYFICSFFSLALVFGYFSRYDFVTYYKLFVDLSNHKIVDEVDNLPLQLCNFGILVSFFAYALKSKKIFYFNYLVNFFGFVMALIMVNLSGDFFRSTTIHYFENHIYGLLLIILGLSLKIFEKPSLKDFRNSLIMFSIYFVVIALIDFILCYDLEEEIGADFLFLNSTKYSDLLHIGFLREPPFVIKIVDSYNLEHRIYYLYWIVVYVIFSLIMFIVYLLTTLVYKIGDKRKQKK